MNELLKAFLAAGGGSLLGAVTIYILLRLFDEPLKSLMHVSAAKEVGRFKAELDEQLESFKKGLQSELNLESLQASKQIAYLEQQLSEFYWPLYWRLQKDNAVWRWILEWNADDQHRRSIGRAIETDFILPNHQEAVQIIQASFHLAQCDDELENLLLRYVRHVAVYQAIRKTPELRALDPDSLEERWPKGLFAKVKGKTEELQAEFERLTGAAWAPNPGDRANG